MVVCNCRFLAIRIALFLRKTSHTQLDILGYSPAEWKKRKQRRMEAKRLVNRRFSQTFKFPSLARGSGSQDSVWFRNGVEGDSASSETASLEISSRHSPTKHLYGEGENSSQVVSVEVLPS